MRLIPLETRREILRAKLDGATNRDVANEYDVSVGSVSNIVEEARSGEFEDFGSLEAHVDGLIELGTRLNNVDLDVNSALIGLDVYSWITDLGLEPADVEKLKADIERLTAKDDDIARYGPALRTILSLEGSTGLAIGNRLGELIESLAERDPEDVQRLAVISRQVQTLPGGLDQLESVVNQAVEIITLGFDLQTAQRLGQELDVNGADKQQASIQSLVDVYAEYDRLSEAVEELTATKEDLESDCKVLRERRSTLDEEPEQLQDTVDRVQQSLDSVEETLVELRATRTDIQSEISQQRDRLEGIESDLQTKKSELEAVQDEREVVHAYRQFLVDTELSDALLRDIGQLLDIESVADTPHLDPYETDIRERTISELRDVAYAMLEGEEMMPVAEHERKLREKGETERTLEELEAERQAVLAFMDFLDTGEISERLLTELRDLKRGRSSLPEFGEKRRSREVREFLVQELKALTEGETVITERRHRERLQEMRSRHRVQINDLNETLGQLTAFLNQLPTLFDDRWTTDIARQVVATLDDTHEELTVDTLKEAFREVFSDEFDRRLDFDPEDRLSEEGVRGGGVDLGSLVNTDIQHSDADDE